MLQRVPQQSVIHDEEVQLNGNHDWQQLWETLTAFAERFEMDSVELMVNRQLETQDRHRGSRRMEV